EKSPRLLDDALAFRRRDLLLTERDRAVDGLCDERLDRGLIEHFDALDPFARQVVEGDVRGALLNDLVNVDRLGHALSRSGMTRRPPATPRGHPRAGRNLHPSATRSSARAVSRPNRRDLSDSPDPSRTERTGSRSETKGGEG